ncbi:glycosyltransferase family 4 protein [Microbulbifer sp. DLAB2-AF]|uniref:glycosyltransferase family 4 protein n=1 Tax=Microbulbifer sp. DLAB2-AF TaxID=3243395 RepID=UPI004039FCC1
MLSFYYSPDLSAGSFRSQALVDALIRRLPNDVIIHVIAAQPNRYASSVQLAPPREVLHGGRLIINRLDVPLHKGGFISQSYSFLIFAVKVITLVKVKKFDFVFATSSRLMTATLGSFISRVSGAAFFVDIRDIFVDNLKHILPKGVGSLGVYFFSMLERWTLRPSIKLNLVSKGFEKYFSNRYPEKKLSWFSNGIDELFINAKERYHKQRDPSVSRLNIVYAGNIGKAQGLDRFIPEFAPLIQNDFDILIFGDGVRREALESSVRRLNINNVKISNPVPRERLVNIYKNADILLLHLENFESMENVLPSKIFEYGATGKPILAGVSGFARKFIQEEIENSAVFTSFNLDEALEGLKSLRVEVIDRKNFICRYLRCNIMNEMAGEIGEIISGRNCSPHGNDL